MLPTTSREVGVTVVDHAVDAVPSLVEALTLAHRQASRGLAAVLAEDGCTVEQWRVLRALSDGHGHLMGELADTLQVAPPTLTRVTDGLADAGLVYRRQASADRRRVSAHLSRQGRSRLQRLDALARAHEDALRSSPEWAEVTDVLRGIVAG
jgi:DNA-binding MarR family transcriptional regulator